MPGSKNAWDLSELSGASVQGGAPISRTPQIYPTTDPLPHRVSSFLRRHFGKH